jgi:hypothetical protein
MIDLEQIPPDLSRGDSLSSLGERGYRIDSPVGATRMPKSLSGDLRERVIEAAEAGASRRKAAMFRKENGRRSRS